MVAFRNSLVASLFAAGTLAAPAANEKRSWDSCLTRAQAQQVATNYGNLIATYTKELADAALAPNFTDYSESVNTLINSCPQGSAAISLPLLSPTFSNLTAFEVGQGQQPNINFNQLNLWYSCDSVTIRWLTTNTAPGPNVQPVVGLIVLEVIPNTSGGQYPFLIDTVYSEFDAGAWLQNLQAAGICKSSENLPGVCAPSSPPSGPGAPATSPVVLPPPTTTAAPQPPSQWTPPPNLWTWTSKPTPSEWSTTVTKTVTTGWYTTGWTVTDDITKTYTTYIPWTTTVCEYPGWTTTTTTTKSWTTSSSSSSSSSWSSSSTSSSTWSTTTSSPSSYGWGPTTTTSWSSSSTSSPSSSTWSTTSSSSTSSSSSSTWSTTSTSSTSFSSSWASTPTPYTR